MKALRAALAAIALALLAPSCATGPTPLQPRTVVAPTGPAAAAVPGKLDATGAAGARRDAAADDNSSKIAASAAVIVDVNSAQPPSALTTSVDGEAHAILQRAGPAQAQDLEDARQRALVAKSGDLAKVQANNLQLAADAAAARKLLEDLRKQYERQLADLNAQVATAQAEAKQLQGQYQARIDEITKTSNERIAAADQRAREAEEKARKWWLNVAHLVLIGLGVVGILVGAATLYFSKGSEWIRAALAAGCGGICFVGDWSLGQPFMKWVVGGCCVAIALAIAGYVITELRSHRTVERLAAAAEAGQAKLAAVAAEVDPKLSAARKIIAAFDSFYESADATLKAQLDVPFTELRGQMDQLERNAVHALRMEANTNTRGVAVPGPAPAAAAPAP